MYKIYGDFGGHNVIEIATFDGDEYVVERRWDAEAIAE